MGESVKTFVLVSIVSVALLVSAVPTHAADGVTRAQEGWVVAGSKRVAGEWWNLDYAYPYPTDGRTWDSEDAWYVLRLSAKRKATAVGRCRAVIYVQQWNPRELVWDTVLERQLWNNTRKVRKSSVSTDSYDFRFGDEPTYLGMWTNGKCAEARGSLWSHLPWYYR
jgi:hypothetical protein